MKSISLFFLNVSVKKIYITLCVLVFSSQVVAQKTPLRRENSFFGLHFDFHATLTDSLMGKTLSEGMIDSLLSATKPDFIQVDCKGHEGVTSYPTKVANGTHVKSFVKDPLALFRKVTKKHGVALYVHYSGVWDDAALKKHPEWAVIDAKGIASTKKTSVHSAYVDELMIPELKEIADYGIDGVWVDGDCWATELDYSPKAIEKFTKQTGISNAPKNPQDADYQVFKDFARQSFKDYVGHYVDVLHQYKPSFQVASNWAYSSFMPVPVELNVDFMSGDIYPMDGVNSAVFESRILAAQSRKYKKPWDLMSWSFNTTWTFDVESQKTALNLNQEVAEIIATGGGYQCYFTQNRDASIRVQQVKIMAEIAKFARARQAFTQGATAIPQIALLYSLASYNKYNNGVYNNSLNDPIKGVVTALMDGQNAVEILTEDHLKGNMSKYPLIVIPEWIYLEPNFLKELEIYVQNGGKLLVIGSEAVKNFKEPLQIDLTEKSKKERFWVGNDDGIACVLDSLQKVSLKSGARALGQFYFVEDTRFPSGISASMSDFGKGKIAGIYLNLGMSYKKYQSPFLRDFLNSIVNQLFTTPIVQLKGSKLVHITVNELKGKLAINLINAGGNHNSDKIYTYDELPALTDLTLDIRVPQKPQKIMQQPENKPLNFTYKNGVATVLIPKLAIHSIIMVD
jgi:hypothetical protein